MFCTALRYQTSSENLSQVVKLFKERLVPLISRQPGFKGVYLLTKSTGECMVLNIWDTEKQATSWPQNPEHQQIAGQLKSLLIGTSVREGYEVQACAVAQSA